MSDQDVTALQNAQTIAKQPSFILLFVVAAVVTVAGAVSIFMAGLNGVGLFVAIAALVGVSVATKQGDNIMIGVATLLAVLSGLTSATLLYYVVTGSAPSAAEVYGGSGGGEGGGEH